MDFDAAFWPNEHHMIRGDEPDGPSGEGVPGAIARHASGRGILEVGDRRVVAEHHTVEGGPRRTRSRCRGCRRRCPGLCARWVEQVPADHYVVVARRERPLRGDGRYRYGRATRGT